MRTLSRIWMALVVGVTIMAITATSWAGPLMPSFPSEWTPGKKVAGQSTLGVSSGDGVPITVDWVVVFWGNVGPGGAPLWGYYYQIENPETQPHSEKTVAVFTISTLPPYGPFVAADLIADTSLDNDFADIYGTVPGHTAKNYSNLAEETEPSPGNIQNPTGFNYTLGDVTYYFGPPPTKEIQVGNQSTILVGYATLPPVYGIATAQDTNVQWRGSVPVPSPEPGAVVLLMTGLMGVGIFRKYRK